MDHQYHLLPRRATAHYSSMLASLLLLAGCASSDLTESSETSDVALAKAVTSADYKHGRGHRNRTEVTAITVSPSTVTLKPDAPQQFAATAKLEDGTTANTRVTWSATGGQIDGSGLYTPGRAGSYLVVATSQYSGLADTAAVTVSETASPTVVSVSVTPATVTLTAGGTQRFAVSGKLSDGSTTLPTVTWKVTGGSINAEGLYTAGNQAGTYRAIATHANNVADTATVTIDAPTTPSEPPPSDPPSAVGCPASGYRRTVNVASSSALGSALSAAQPGDQIQLASGTYSGTVTISRRGTAADSITLCGPSTAIIAGAVHMTDAEYWRLQGFQVRDGWIGIQMIRSSHNRIAGLNIHDVGHSGIKITDQSNDNVVQRNWIHRTARTSKPGYGEGVYIGEGQSSATTAQRTANRNLIQWNRFGPDITAEHVDVKLGTQDNVVRWNSHDATGFGIIWTATSTSGSVTAALVILDGTNQRLEADTVRNLLESDPNNWAVFRTYAGSGTVVTDNVVIGPTTAKRFYDKDHASSTVVRCDNVKPSTLAWGTTCTN